MLLHAGNFGPRIAARVYRGSSTVPVIQHLQKAVGLQEKAVGLLCSAEGV